MTKFENNPLWFKDAVIYQLHVKAFYDSTGDGMGDFRGLIEKLDYLGELGITAIWLLPFYPSPLRDDGYDIADYFSVHPSYGTVEDFQEVLEQAHRRGMRVITELVLNHTSDQNAWFQRARRAAPGSDERNFYVWSDAPDRYTDARIIFKDFEQSNWTYDPVARAYFWHRFYSHQPDLNFDHPPVHDALFEVIDFWLAMGVDGLRLDAVPYLYEREGTNCENLPETHAFLRKLRAHMDANFENRMILAEANQWPEDAAAYFGAGDECHMNFNFPLMPRLYMALQMEDRFPIIDILDQTPALPEGCQWATFLRNHDELTLEMVTDEERDYMWRMYAADPRARINLGIRRRLAPLLLNSRRKIELLNTLLLSLPGTPIIYYGDEIGMGDNFYLGDRNGVRTPMQWSPDRNAGFSKANPQQLFLPAIIDPEYHFEAVNVENQERNVSSLLWWTRRVLAMRNRFKAFGRGTIEFLSPDNAKVLAFVRRYEDEVLLVIVNLSRFAQVVELNLAPYAGMIPVEVFSQNRFPLVKETPYVFTLAPHDHYWLLLQAAQPTAESVLTYTAPSLDLAPSWAALLSADGRDLLESSVLPRYLLTCRWFGGKARPLRTVEISETLTLADAADTTRLLFVNAIYSDGTPETYLLPLGLANAAEAATLAADAPTSIVARFGDGSALFDAIYDGHFRAHLLRTIVQNRQTRGAHGQVAGFRGRAVEELAAQKNVSLASQVLKVEQSNSSIVYESRLFLKLYRKLEEGVNPDAEIIRYLSEKQQLGGIPPFGGSIEYRALDREPRVLGLLLGMVQNEGDAWAYTLDAVGRYFERVLAEKPDPSGIAAVPLTGDAEVSPVLSNLVGGIYPERARQLGIRTAEMHLALAAEGTDANFAPEPFTTLYQRSVYQSMRASVRRMTQLLQRQIGSVPAEAREAALDLIAAEAEILQRQARLHKRKIVATKIRTHGDYHLGQVLNTGKDFVIIDFEGEPSRSLTERKLKRTPIRDVAGMIRSFHYAAHTALSQGGMVRPEDLPSLTVWAHLWATAVSRTFLQAYLEAADGASFIPKTAEDLDILIDAYLLDKAVYEVGYELNNRPSWVSVPIRGILALLKR
jgi:maltose alpha-D-glucosyltransferase/alpha-amylase